MQGHTVPRCASFTLLDAGVSTKPAGGATAWWRAPGVRDLGARLLSGGIDRWPYSQLRSQLLKA